MKQIFDFMRRRVNENISTGRFGVGVFLDTINEAEAKWESECCIWEGFDNSLTKGKIEWTYKITCQSQPRYIPEEYTDSLWTHCPYCGKPIKIVEVE